MPGDAGRAKSTRFPMDTAAITPGGLPRRPARLDGQVPWSVSRRRPLGAASTRRRPTKPPGAEPFQQSTRRGPVPAPRQGNLFLGTSEQPRERAFQPALVPSESCQGRPRWYCSEVPLLLRDLRVLTFLLSGLRRDRQPLATGFLGVHALGAKLHKEVGRVTLQVGADGGDLVGGGGQGLGMCAPVARSARSQHPAAQSLR